MRTFKNIKFEFKDNKARTTLVFFHGYNASSDSFENLYPLENNFNIISVNFPGNKYPDGIMNLSMDELVNEFDLFIKNIRTKIVLVGHSFGGALISEITSTEKICAYVFISSFTKSILDSKIHSALLKIAGKKMPAVVLNAMINIAVKRMNLEIEDAAKFSSPAPGFEKIYSDNILNINYIGKHLDKNIRKISKPIEAIIGSKDLIIPVTQYQNYFDGLGVDVHTIENAKHNPVHANAVNVNDFLNSKFKFKRRWRRKLLK